MDGNPQSPGGGVGERLCYGMPEVAKREEP